MLIVGRNHGNELGMASNMCFSYDCYTILSLIKLFPWTDVPTTCMQFIAFNNNKCLYRLVFSILE